MYTKEDTLGLIELEPTRVQRNLGVLRDDEEFCLRAIALSPVAAAYISPKLRKNKSFMMKAIGIRKLANLKSKRFIFERWQNQIFELAHATLKSDREFMEAALALNFPVLDHLHGSMREDKRFILKALRSDRLAVSDDFGNCLSLKLRGDKKVMLAAVSRRGTLLKFCTPPLNWDLDIVGEALDQDSQACEFLPEAYRDAKEFVSQVVAERGYLLRFMSDRLKDDRELALLSVKSFGAAYEYVSDRLKADREVAITAFSQCGEMLALAPPKFQNDAELCRVAVAEDSSSFQYASDELRHDPRLAILVCESSDEWVHWLDYMSPRLQQCIEESTEYPAVALEKEYKRRQQEKLGSKLKEKPERTREKRVGGRL